MKIRSAILQKAASHLSARDKRWDPVTVISIQPRIPVGELNEPDLHTAAVLLSTLNRNAPPILRHKATVEVTKAENWIVRRFSHGLGDNFTTVPAISRLTEEGLHQLPIENRWEMFWQAAAATGAFFSSPMRSIRGMREMLDLQRSARYYNSSGIPQPAKTSELLTVVLVLVNLHPGQRISPLLIYDDFVKSMNQKGILPNFDSFTVLANSRRPRVNLLGNFSLALPYDPSGTFEENKLRIRSWVHDGAASMKLGIGLLVNIFRRQAPSFGPPFERAVSWSFTKGSEPGSSSLSVSAGRGPSLRLNGRLADDSVLLCMQHWGDKSRADEILGSLRESLASLEARSLKFGRSEKMVRLDF